MAMKVDHLILKFTAKKSIISTALTFRKRTRL